MRPNNKHHRGAHCQKGPKGPEPVSDDWEQKKSVALAGYRTRARCLSTKNPFSLQAGPDFAYFLRKVLYMQGGICKVVQSLLNDLTYIKTLQKR
jgi:hypothetical protein